MLPAAFSNRHLIAGPDRGGLRSGLTPSPAGSFTACGAPSALGVEPFGDLLEHRLEHAGGDRRDLPHFDGFGEGSMSIR